MEITWYGQSCFRIRTRGVAVVTDPYGPELGPTLPRLRAHIVTVSHQHPNHSYIRAVRGGAYVIQGPGEYEVRDTFIFGVATTHNTPRDQNLGPNTSYLIEMEEMSICHLGDLGQPLTQEQVEELQNVDILLVPVGGRDTLTPSGAAEVISQLEPSVVIPMHYKVPGIQANLGTLQRFLKEMGVDEVSEVEAFSVTKSQLGEDPRVVVLKPTLE
ncbi:MAG: MBL fold metallo-hydrolase [Anaerolineae bacterium]|jgi:L-ascorbate metabolism protein UlaG (beta-lactamase superfamily)